MGRRVRFGEYEVDFARRELRKGGVRVALQHKPFRVLELLLRQPGELVSREELVAYLWPDSHVSFERGLNTAVNTLRQVLGESSRECHFIETRSGLGYRFSAAVQEVTNPANTGAFEDCLRGRYFLDKLDEEEVQKAIAHFNAAAEDRSCRAAAHAGIAEAYCQLALMGSGNPAKLEAGARRCADSALKEDPALAQAHVASGAVKLLFDWDWDQAAACAARALELDPTSVSGYLLQALLLCTSGSYEEGLAACRQAVRLQPLSFPANLQYAVCLHCARQYARAVDQCWKMLNMLPLFAPAQIVLALAYQQLGMADEAIVEFQNAQCRLGDRPIIMSGLAHVYAALGRHREAEQMQAAILKQAQSGYVPFYWQAVLCAGLGEFVQAQALLEQSRRMREPAALWTSGADARLDVLSATGALCHSE